MNIVTIRRITQAFFLILFIWFCVVMNLGDKWWQLRGWPTNWILQLDPLVGLATLLTTGTLYRGLIWGLATVVLTIFVGRFFCGWLCPFGTLHQVVGYLGHRHKKSKQKRELNRYRQGQKIKYAVLTVLLAMAAADLVFMGSLSFGSSLLTGILDPIPLFYRSVHLIAMPLADAGIRVLSAQPRFYLGAGLIGGVFLLSILLNLWIPRFYCRFICPLGALFGVLSRFAVWRMGKVQPDCTDCRLCEKSCQGACEPAARIRLSECFLCMNCLKDCHHSRIRYQTALSAQGEITAPDLSRRGFVLSLATGLVAVPALRINGSLASAWDPSRVRPPGALAEPDFLHRCIKCGQCMRICPTNVIQPAGPSAGIEGLWTPVLDFRIGTSGCQHNCIACGHVCPTAAIRPLLPDERTGAGSFSNRGPLKIGTAFLDRGRCLPWAMQRPCLVCQENCPVSPKAITTRIDFSSVPLPPLTATRIQGSTLYLSSAVLKPGRYGTGDYYVLIKGSGNTVKLPVLTNTDQTLTVLNKKGFAFRPEETARVEMVIRLQQPFVDPEKCIGCGVCEHECPVKGKRAIRVTAENETRHREHTLSLAT